MRLRSASHLARLFSARFSITLWISFSSTTWFACAEQHSAEELIARAGSRPNHNSSDDPINVDPPVMGPLDAGPHVPRDIGVDAGRMRPDARVPFPTDGGVSDARIDAALDSSFRDGGQHDAASDASSWQSTDAATVDVSVVAACDPTLPADAGVDAGADAGTSCRTGGWHTPPCYRAPSDCPALKESIACSGFDADGNLRIVGLDRGTSCRIVQDPKYPQGAGSNAFAQIGADIYSIAGDVILKRSLTDGSFDVAPVQAWTIFAMGDALIILTTDGTINRYASWAALKSGAAGEKLATATPGRTPAFGANRTTIAAAWPDGALYLLTVGEARQRSLRLVGYSLAESGAIRGLDLADDGRLFLATDLGLSIYNSADGRLISRMRTPAMTGLSCEAGMTSGTIPPVLPLSPRPGYYAASDSGYVIASGDCRGPFNGPRYVGEKAGAELFVIGNFFTDPSIVRDERSTPHTLVLTTVEATQWNVVVSATSKLERILVNGSTSTVVLQSPVSIPIETFFDSRSLGQHSGEWPSLEESRFRAAIETQVGRPVTESFGCHFGSTYVIRDLPALCAAP